MKNTRARHALSELCGDMTPDEFISLQDSIGNDGVAKPVVIYEDQVLDGWHRYSIATDLGVDCPEVQFDGGPEDARAFVLREHTRRNWTPSQRAYCIVAISEWIPCGQPRRSAPGADIHTSEQMAQEAGTSVRTIEQAKKVRRQAVPEVKKAVVDGDVSLKRAAQIADKPKKAQAKALTEKPNVTAGPWKPATPMPRPVLGPSQQAFDELKEKNSILVDEIDRLNDRLAVERMEDVTDDERLLASTTIAELRAENKTLIAELRAVKAVRDNLMGEVREMTSQLQKQRVMLQKQRA